MGLMQESYRIWDVGGPFKLCIDELLLSKPFYRYNNIIGNSAVNFYSLL